MKRRLLRLVCTAALAGSPLLTPAAALAAPTLAPQPTLTTPADPGARPGEVPASAAIPRPEPGEPITPIPMNLPDEAHTDELSGQYVIGIVSLIIATLLVAALVIGAFYVISRRSWSATRRA